MHITVYILLVCVACTMGRRAGVYTYVKTPHVSYQYNLERAAYTRGRAGETQIASEQEEVAEVPQPLQPLQKPESKPQGVRGRTSSLSCTDNNNLGMAKGTNCSSYFDVCVQLNSGGSHSDDIINKYRIKCEKNEYFLEGSGCVPFTEVPQCKPDPVPEITCTRNGLFSMCEKYVKCTRRGGEYEKEVLECSDGLVFDESTSRCTDRSKVEKCQPFTCDRPGVFRDPRDCRKFHVCGIPADSDDDNEVVKSHTSYECPSGYVFAKREGSPSTTCILANSDDVEKCNFNIEVGRIADLEGSADCSEAGFRLDSTVDDCRGFYQCIPTPRGADFARFGEYECPAEGKFDTLLNLCLKEPILDQECSGRRRVV